jgi:hypothetical protein
MQFNLICRVVSAVLLSLVAGCVWGQSSSVTVDAASLGPEIGPMHYGIFYEEINHAGEGGLWAELIKNRSFEDSSSNLRCRGSARR